MSAITTNYMPGPWQIDSHEDGDYFWISPVASGGYGWVGGRYLQASGHMDISDARLIASAPELLEALQGLLPDAVGNHIGGPDTQARIDAARAAIDKATRGVQ